MGPQKNSFANRIRIAAQNLSKENEGKDFNYLDLSHEAFLQSRADEKKMKGTVRDFVKSGEMSRISPGVFIYNGKSGKGLPLNEQMWNFLKIKKSVTVEDLQKFGGNKDYIMEWLRLLLRREVVQAEKNGRYILIAECDMPDNDEKAEQLRVLRAKKKKAALAALTLADKALAKVRAELDGL